MKGFYPLEGNPQEHPKVILGSAVMQNISSYNKQGSASHSALQNQQTVTSHGVSTGLDLQIKTEQGLQFLQTKPKLSKGPLNISVKCGYNSQFCHIEMCQGKVCDEN